MDQQGRLVPMNTPRFIEGAAIATPAADDWPAAATAADAARRLASGILHPLPTPVEVLIGVDAATLTVEHRDHLLPWAHWVQADPVVMSSIYRDAGLIVRALLYRSLWRGYVINVRHLQRSPVSPMAVAS
jgi:hypothetical protein